MLKSLTGNVFGPGKGLSNVVVELDEEVLLLRQFAVAVLNHSVDPVREGLANHAIHDVDHPLSREFVPVLLVGKELQHFRELLGLREDVLERQAIVLRREEVRHLRALDV